MPKGWAGAPSRASSTCNEALMPRRQDLDRILLALLLVGVSDLGATTYYVRPSGSDSRAGTSEAAAWKTLAKVSAFKLADGDRVLFEGGKEFKGTLEVDRSDGGTPAAPLVFGSFGRGRASIRSGDLEGLKVTDRAAVEVEELNFIGNGASSTESGISFFTMLPGDVKLEHVVIRNCDASGYGKRGISIGAWPESGYSGFKGVSVTGCRVFGNTDGISTWGRFNQPHFHHEDVHISHCQAYQNDGLLAQASPSGSGIVVSSVDRGLVEHCVVHDNGKNNEPTSGPAGIWTYQANRIVIQYNEAYAMSCGSGGDGDGFDLDGGTTNSVVQYNYAHDNDGAGILVCNYVNGLVNDGNVVRYNLSVNDCRKNEFGGISLWGANPKNKVTRLQVHNNTIHVGKDSAEAASCVQSHEMNLSDIYFRNNIFIAADGRRLVNLNKALTREIRFQGNVYWTPNGAFEIQAGPSRVSSLAQWRKQKPGAFQEALNGGKAVGGSVDPGLEGPPTAPILGDTARLGELTAWRLKPGSTLAGKGLNLKRLFGLDPGPRDYFGTPLPVIAWSIGAHEGTAKPAP